MTNDVTRDDHLQWCIARALEYVERGQLQDAFASMGSDLSKHEGTRDHPGIGLGAWMLLHGHLKTQEEMRQFIRGFA